MPTPSVFDFDPDRLDDYNEERIDRILQQHPAIYLNHLEIARALDGWAEREEERGAIDGERSEGMSWVLREIAAHLRQGDYVPDGPMLH